MSELGKSPSTNEQHFRCAQTKNVFIFFSRTCTTTTPAFENDDGFLFELFFLSVRLRAVVVFKEGITILFYPKSHPSSSMGLLRSSSSSSFRPRKFSVSISASQSSSSEGASGEEKKERMKRVLSGVQPTGSIHLGNYFGAIQNYVKLQDEHEAFYCVVDLHAITAGGHSPKELEESTRKSAAIYLAAGVSPEKASVFVQSQTPPAQRTVLAVERVANRMVGEDDSVQRKSEETRRGRVGWTFRLSGVDGGRYFVV